MEAYPMGYAIHAISCPENKELYIGDEIVANQKHKEMIFLCMQPLRNY